MATILNSTNYTLSVSAQQAVRNAMANAGVDEVRVGVHPNDGNKRKKMKRFNCFYWDGNFASTPIWQNCFSIEAAAASYCEAENTKIQEIDIPGKFFFILEV